MHFVKSFEQCHNSTQLTCDWLAFAKKIRFYFLQKVWNVYFLFNTIKDSSMRLCKDDTRAKSILKNKQFYASYVKELQNIHPKRLKKPRKKP